MSLGFMNGKWIEIQMPSPIDKTWSKDDKFTYISIFIKCRKMGLKEEKAAQLAEAAVMKMKYDGLRYEPALEKEIKGLLGIA